MLLSQEGICLASLVLCCGIDGFPLLHFGSVQDYWLGSADVATVGDGMKGFKESTVTCRLVKSHGAERQERT